MAEAQDQDLEEVLQAIEGIADEGDAEETDPSASEVEKARRIALEECLHTIATYALELAAGKRQEISAEDVRFAFATHDLEEIYTEAQIFFGAVEEPSDLGADPAASAGQEDEDDPDAEDAGEEGEGDEDEDEA